MKIVWTLNVNAYEWGCEIGVICQETECVWVWKMRRTQWLHWMWMNMCDKLKSWKLWRY